jgi:hypothetical protein
MSHVQWDAYIARITRCRFASAVLINIFFGFNNAWWAWTTFPGVGLMVGLLIGMNIKKEGK